MILTSDFETTTNPDDCRVWAWGLCEVGNVDNFTHNETITQLIDYCSTLDNPVLYFHNLKFDGTFILVWLFENGFKHVLDRRDLQSKTFTTLISDKGQFYSMTIMLHKTEHKSKKIVIYDSLKLLPFSVKEVAKSFNLPIKKGEIDYDKPRPKGYKMDANEMSYLRNDVTIMAMALSTLFAQNLNKMTAGSNALHDLKQTITPKLFNLWFPVPTYDADVRQSYKGGFTYLNPIYADIDIYDGIVLDVNSLYPSVMRNRPMPYGEGIYFKGEYQNDDLYPLYIQMFTCNFELKAGHIPTIQLKNNLSFIPTEYLTSSEGNDITLCLTNIDLDLFKAHYDIYNMEYLSGWKFKAATGLFAKYVDKWSTIKINSKLEGNKGMYTLAKLMMNSSYGKFALNPIVRSKIPYYDQGIIKYVLGEKETRDPVYIPVGTFTTSWARYTTITAAQKVYNRFIYGDTDSLHLKGLEIPEELEISDTILGQWKHESTFKKARFLRQKSYFESNIVNDKEYGKMEADKKALCYMMDNTRVTDKITCAGMPESCYQYVTWENFHPGISYEGKLQQKAVKGGIILQNIDFSIKR